MEKLIEYLTEFSSEDFNWEYREGKIYDRQNMYPDGDLLEEMTVYVISKKFGFIKWLVDNDKIDKEKVWKNESPDIFDYSFYEVVLMLLSIQDNPIEFLVSILR